MKEFEINGFPVKMWSDSMYDFAWKEAEKSGLIVKYNTK